MINPTVEFPHQFSLSQNSAGNQNLEFEEILIISEIIITKVPHFFPNPKKPGMLTPFIKPSKIINIEGKRAQISPESGEST